MSYAVKSIFYTLQGEGVRTGRPAVFLRFSGCNLWSGREEDRATAVCHFCDTDFVGTDGPGGEWFNGARDLAERVRRLWPDTDEGRPYVVCTGGEPLLQLDRSLVDSLRRVGFEVAVETNGTLALPEGIDWICVSPKAGVDLRLRAGDELKLVYPQPGLDPADLVGLNFGHFRLQPLDDPQWQRNTLEAVRYCLAHPRWTLSLQMHKILGVP